MKHLKVLEDNDLVVSIEEKSTLGGPPRKSYTSKKRISLRIDVGPNTFNSEVYDYREYQDSKPEPEIEVTKESDITEYHEKYLKSQDISDINDKLKEYSKIINDINKKLDKLKVQRSQLISLRENIIQESNKIIVQCCNQYDERKILYYLLAHPNSDLETISDVMEMRIKSIEEIFDKLMKRKLFLDETNFF